MSENVLPTEEMSCWVIVPAAGIGRRMRSEIPKQYLPLDGYTVLEHSLTRLSVMPAVREIIVALAPDDPYWPKHRFERVAKPIRAVEGGKERSDSVINALHALTTCAKPDDWVLVHDAARPCVRISDIQKLLDECQSDPVGGLLAVPVRDTMKQAGIDGRVAHTVAREYLWHALTPQMFRFGKLVQALTQAQANKIPVTDEAMAMELAGMQARLVEGHADNIKITRPEDLTLAAFYLREQSEQGVPYYYDGMEDGG